MKTAIIYKIENLVNQDCYIGSSTNYSRRKNRHFKSLKHNIHHSIILQRAYNKYGENNFILKIIVKFPYFSKEDILLKEQYYIDRNNSKYNVCKIAGNQLGSKRTEEFKRSCSIRMLGKPSWNKNIKTGPQSEETKKKRSLSLTGHIVKDKTRELIKNKVSKPIIQYTSDNVFIREWASPKQAAKELSFSYPRLTDYLNGKSNIQTFKNFIWKRKI